MKNNNYFLYAIFCIHIITVQGFFTETLSTATVTGGVVATSFALLSRILKSLGFGRSVSRSNERMVTNHLLAKEHRVGFTSLMDSLRALHYERNLLPRLHSASSTPKPEARHGLYYSYVMRSASQPSNSSLSLDKRQANDFNKTVKDTSSAASVKPRDPFLTDLLVNLSKVEKKLSKYLLNGNVSQRQTSPTQRIVTNNSKAIPLVQSSQFAKTISLEEAKKLIQQHAEKIVQPQPTPLDPSVKMEEILLEEPDKPIEEAHHFEDMKLLNLAGEKHVRPHHGINDITVNENTVLVQNFLNYEGYKGDVPIKLDVEPIDPAMMAFGNYRIKNVTTSSLKKL